MGDRWLLDFFGPRYPEAHRAQKRRERRLSPAKWKQIKRRRKISQASRRRNRA